MVTVSQEINEFHHTHDLLLGEPTLHGETVARALLVCYLDFNPLSQRENYGSASILKPGMV